MRATVIYGAEDVRIENVPDARLIEPTDALATLVVAPPTKVLRGIRSFG
jgi:hypothetical protein